MALCPVDFCPDPDTYLCVRCAFPVNAGVPQTLRVRAACRRR